MAIVFYPADEDVATAPLDEKLTVLQASAESYRAIVTDALGKYQEEKSARRTSAPRDLHCAYNWEVIARTLREIRDLPEASPAARLQKGARLTKLAEIYEILRAAKMPKLEAVRIALATEASQLR